jgi:hypothetical protein
LREHQAGVKAGDLARMHGIRPRSRTPRFRGDGLPGQLTELIAHRSKPGMIVSDHGAEFPSNAILRLVEGTSGGMALHSAGRLRSPR